MLTRQLRSVRGFIRKVCNYFMIVLCYIYICFIHYSCSNFYFILFFTLCPLNNSTNIVNLDGVVSVKNLAANQYTSIRQLDGQPWWPSQFEDLVKSRKDQVHLTLEKAESALLNRFLGNEYARILLTYYIQFQIS